MNKQKKLTYPLFFASLILAACIIPSAMISTPTQSTHATVEIQNTPAQITYTVTADQSLHIRSEANYESTVIGCLYHGDTVTAIGKPKGEWLPIKQGWVNINYVEADNDRNFRRYLVR